MAHAPAYRAWRLSDPGPAHSTDHRYACMPVVTKRELRAHFPNGFLPPGRDLDAGLASGEVEFVSTSGTTSERLVNLWHQPWWNASERASWRLNADADRIATGSHREAILASPLSTGFLSVDRDLPIEERTVERFMYLNYQFAPGEWTAAYQDRMADDLARFKPLVLEANPSLLARFARFLVQNRRSVFQPPLIVLTFEFPSRLHLRWIRRAFSAPVCSSYGSTETGYVFMECEAGRFHQNVDFCRVDFQPWRREHGGPATGRILVTALGHPWFLLLRYDVGDAVRLEERGPCPCGRDRGLTLSSIEGRIRDVTFTTAGRAVTVNRLDEALSAVPGLFTYQVEQLERSSYLVHCVGDGTGNGDLAAATAAALMGVYGEAARVEPRVTDRIAPEASGKFRLAKFQEQGEAEDLLDPAFPRASA